MEYKYRLINLEYIKGKDNEDILSFFRYNGIKKFDKNDIDVLKKITFYIRNKKEFNVSYNIDRLDKEFDLVKLDDNKVINIELKLTSKDLKQCKQNYKILKNHYKNSEVYVYCYEMENNLLFLYDNENKIMTKQSFDDLNNNLNTVIKGKLLSINININSIYLNPNYFFSRQYELSSCQQKTKEKVVLSDKKINLITGRAGTGKTLLALDIYSDYYFEFEKVIYLTPFKKNDIINKDLRDYFPIKTVREFIASDEEYDICIIDEAQRMNEGAFQRILNKIKKKVILFGDIYQNIDSECYFEELRKDKENNNVFNMNMVIRTDDTFDVFAKKVLNYSTSGIKNKRIDKNKIDVYMLSDESLEGLQEYIFLEPAKSLKYKDCTDNCLSHMCYDISKKCLLKKTPYDVIGQEYDNVAMFFCNAYKIRDNKIIATDQVCIGNLERQLYSLMTRAVKKLKIIVVDIELYNYFSKIKENL